MYSGSSAGEKNTLQSLNANTILDAGDGKDTLEANGGVLFGGLNGNTTFIVDGDNTNVLGFGNRNVNQSNIAQFNITANINEKTNQWIDPSNGNVNILQNIQNFIFGNQGGSVTLFNANETVQSIATSEKFSAILYGTQETVQGAGTLITTQNGNEISSMTAGSAFDIDPTSTTSTQGASHISQLIVAAGTLNSDANSSVQINATNAQNIIQALGAYANTDIYLGAGSQNTVFAGLGENKISINSLQNSVQTPVTMSGSTTNTAGSSGTTNTTTASTDASSSSTSATTTDTTTSTTDTNTSASSTTQTTALPSGVNATIYEEASGGTSRFTFIANDSQQNALEINANMASDNKTISSITMTILQNATLGNAASSLTIKAINDASLTDWQNQVKAEVATQTVNANDASLSNYLNAKGLTFDSVTQGINPNSTGNLTVYLDNLQGQQSGYSINLLDLVNAKNHTVVV